MRYLPQTQKSRAEMLAAIGVKTVDDLFADVPKSRVRQGQRRNLPDHAGRAGRSNAR
jgi:glycine dehydrogenase subunit 1